MIKNELAEKKTIMDENIRILDEMILLNTESISNKKITNIDEAEEAILLNRAIKEFEMKKRIIKAKNIHEYPIHHTEKSGWFTVVDDSSRPDGKRKIKKKTEEKLWLALADWYLDRVIGGPTIKDVYEKWIAWKETPRNKANIQRIKISWNSYYLNEPLSQDIINKPMIKITALELRTWAENLLKVNYPVDKKKFSRMFNIVNQCYEYASDPDINIVNDNLWAKAKKKINKDLMVKNGIPADDSQVFTNEERKLIKQMVLEDMETYKDRPTSAGLQILFLFETGLRIGECVGLKWSDIKNGRLYVRRQANNKAVKEWTKTNNGYRDIPLTDEAQRILELVKKYNEEQGFNAEWIFQSANPNFDYRLSYNAASNKLAKLCARIDSVKKSPHKLRKTCLSALLDNPNVNNRTVQRYAGHGDITTTLRYYNFDRSTKEEQAKAINDALALND